MGNSSWQAARRRSPRGRKQLKGRMVKGVFCFVLVFAFATLATSLPLGPGDPVYVCSAPVGTSTGGSAFSDEAFYNPGWFNSPGSKVTAIKIRVGGVALDYIQAHYDGEAGPIHGGKDGPGSDFVFTVPEGTEIVAASGTISERWGYVESINFTTSDGEVHGPFGYNSGEAWTREGGEGHTLGFLKGISGDALDMLSLCWNPTDETGTPGPGLSAPTPDPSVECRNSTTGVWGICPPGQGTPGPGLSAPTPDPGLSPGFESTTSDPRLSP